MNNTNLLALRIATPTTRIFAALALILAALLFIAGCGGPQETPAIPIVASTSHMGALLEALGGDKLSVTVLIPPGSCPGHYDLKPSDVSAIDASNVLFVHSYEAYTDKIVEAVNNPRLIVMRIPAPGNWLVPGTQRQATPFLDWGHQFDANTS